MEAMELKLQLQLHREVLLRRDIRATSLGATARLQALVRRWQAQREASRLDAVPVIQAAVMGWYAREWAALGALSQEDEDQGGGGAGGSAGGRGGGGGDDTGAGCSSTGGRGNGCVTGAMKTGGSAGAGREEAASAARIYAAVMGWRVRDWGDLGERRNYRVFRQYAMQCETTPSCPKNALFWRCD